jgi:hypothetical protein
MSELAEVKVIVPLDHYERIKRAAQEYSYAFDVVERLIERLGGDNYVMNVIFMDDHALYDDIMALPKP